MDSINQLHTLRGKYPYPEVDAVFTSPLKRCKDSAAILFPRNNLITIEDFKEYNFGEFEGKTAAELQDNLDFRDWSQGDMQASPPYGETNAQFMHRVCAAFEKVISGCVQTGTRRIALVCHAGVMMTLLTCYGLPEAPWPTGRRTRALATSYTWTRRCGCAPIKCKWRTPPPFPWRSWSR